jgi:hypothetical protein
MGFPMSPDDKLLYFCARQAFLPKHRESVRQLCESGEVDWQMVLVKAILHSVAPLVYHNLIQRAALQAFVPPEIVEQLELYFYRNVVIKERVASRLADVLAFFNDHTMDVMLIKGAAVDAVVYEHPWYTLSNDVDLVIREKTGAVNDRQIAEHLKPDHKYFEWDYFEHHDVVMNGVLPVDFQRIWEDASKSEFRGQTLFVMSPEDMLISLCISGCRKRFFRLKALLDIAEVIDYFDDLNWKVFTQKARDYQCQNIVYAALLVTRMTLGSRYPDRILDDLGVGPVRARVIRRVMRHACTRFGLPAGVKGRTIFGRQVNWRLGLPYVTFSWNQIWRRARYLWITRGVPNREATAGTPLATAR